MKKKVLIVLFGAVYTGVLYHTLYKTLSIKCKGEKGPAGPKGEKGDRGPKGDCAWVEKHCDIRDMIIPPAKPIFGNNEDFDPAKYKIDMSKFYR